FFSFSSFVCRRIFLSFPTRRSSDLNWSFLSVRSWMYRVVFWLFVLGVMGLIRGRIRSVSGALSLIICYAVFIAGLIYYATQVFQETGTSVAEGWYLTSFIPAEAVLFSAGLQS